MKALSAEYKAKTCRVYVYIHRKERVAESRTAKGGKGA
jgi:hypothetical protein